MANMFKVTAPDGSILKRTSQSRTYTHVIIGRCSYENDFDWANKLNDQERKNYDWYVAMANGTHELAQRRPWKSVEDHAAEIAKYAAEAARAPNRDAYAALKREEALANLAARKAEGDYDVWHAITWCGRPDLVQKAFNKAAKTHWVTDLRILPVAA